MPKRGNDNAQVSKEDYDDEAEEVGDDGRPLGSSGFARADADAGQLQKRRIIKVGRRFRQPGATAGAAGATPASAMTAATPAPAAAASSGGNPFGGIALTASTPAPAAPTPAPTAGGGSNPFAKVNLLGAASATPAPTAPAAFNFGAASNVPKVQPAPKLFPTSQSAAAAAPAPAASKTSTANGNIREDIKLNHDYLTHVVEQIKANPSSDLSAACNEYHKMAEAIEKKLGGSSTGSGGDQDSGDEEKKVEDSTGSGNGAAAKPAGGFSFGASAAAAPAPAAPFSFGATSGGSTSAPSPAPAAAAFSFGAANTSAPSPAPAAAAGGTFGGFSFAAAPAPAPDSAAGKAATTAFSFGNPVAAPVPAPAPAAAADDEGDGNGGFAKEAPAEVQREENKDEDVLFEVRAQYSKHVEIDPEDAPGKKGWKKFAKGPLRLQRHKENGKCRMLMRDSIGKTMLNLSITHGMKFNGRRGQGKASDRGYITFTSAKNESEMELYMLTCKSVDYEKFLAKLEEMAKSSPAS